jgi:hypothetical protein
MADTGILTPLILDLVEWCAEGTRTYDDVMEAWRTSCPRLPVWETALEEGHVRRAWRPPKGTVIEVTEGGLEYLEAHGRGRRMPVGG